MAMFFEFPEVEEECSEKSKGPQAGEQSGLSEESNWQNLTGSQTANQVVLEPAELAELDGNKSPDRSELFAGLRAFSDIEKREVRWLWPRFISKGALTILAGDPGVGKGFLWCDLVARITNGRSWPTGESCEAGNCLILQREDDVSITIKHRLEVAGVNQEKVFHLSFFPSGDGLKEEPVNLWRHLPSLEQLITAKGIRFIVLDPIQDFWNGVKWNQPEQVRAALMPLAEVLQRTGATCLGVCHTNKGDDRSAKDSVAGSKQIIACARAAYQVADMQDGETVALTVIKNNLAPRGKLNWEFHLAKHDPSNDDEVPWVEWLGPSEHRADDFTRNGGAKPRAHRKEAAKDFLQGLLSNGPKSQKEVSAAASTKGISEATLERAKIELGVLSKRVGSCSYWLAKDEDSKLLPQLH